MPKIVVLSQAAVDHMREQGTALSCVLDCNDMINALSADDIATSAIARNDFAFAFDGSLGFEFQPSLMSQMMEADPEANARLYDRVKRRVDTQRLKDAAVSDGREASVTYVYTLYPVNDSLWVVGAQRHSPVEGDLEREQVKKNLAFFDALITQSLHSLEFETLCATNLFTYYVNALSHHKAK